MALGWAPAPWSGLARRWLQGQEIPDADRESIGLDEESPAAIDVLRAIPALFQHQQPMMICCDQLESILQRDDAGVVTKLSTSLMEVLQAVPVQIVLSCFQDSWEKFTNQSFGSFKMRVRQPAFRLEAMKPEHAIRLVKGRMSSRAGRDADRPPSWPFGDASIARLVREENPTPRGLIQACAGLFDTWLEGDRDKEIEFPDGGPIVDLGAAFLREWEREISAISQDPRRSVDKLSQDQLYEGLLEALKLAHSAQRMRAFGGVRIMDLVNNVVRATAPNRRPGARITLSGGPGEEAQAVVVAITDLQASRSFTPYFTALFNAAAEPAARILLIHPMRDLDLGPAARVSFEKAQKEGKLRFLPLEDYPLTFHATECLAALIKRAIAREFVVNGVTLSAEDCRDLVIETGVIDNLDLFKMLGQWNRTGARVAPKLVAVAAGTAPSPALGLTPAATPSTARPVSPANGTGPTRDAVEAPLPPPIPAPVAAELESWAEKKLAGAVKKLNLLGQGVEPDGFEIGPTFARLRVRPVGKTNFKGVCNKAVDLRISLGLEVVPIVGSQAGCISIDVQRPDRAVVSLAEALAGPPSKLAGKPAFPVGRDVGGQSHWLNLADPSDCHLLVAGTTGSGKSEFLRALIASLACRLDPGHLQFILIDPKRVTFNLPRASPYLRSPVAYDLDQALPLVEGCMAEMDRRYQLLEARKLTNVADLPSDLLPRIVLVIDEFASFLEDKESKKVMTALLKRIGAMARAAGIHLILSTQRPDKDVITPLLRENLPGRIALRVSSRAGSDLILGSPDAENLLGKGDLFWKKGGELLRLQGPFASQSELERTLRCRA